MKLIEPVLPDDALAADIEAANPGAGVALWWLGQSGFLVKSAAGRVLFDPYLSDSLTMQVCEYRQAACADDAAVHRAGALVGIDVVTSSAQSHRSSWMRRRSQRVFAR